MTRQDFINRLLLYVSELSDRTSPEDQPEMMLVTGKELENGVMLALEQCDMEIVSANPVHTYEKGINGCWVVYSEGGYNKKRITHHPLNEETAKAIVAVLSNSSST